VRVRIVTAVQLAQIGRWTPAAVVGTAGKAPPRGVFPGEGYTGERFLYEASGEYRAPRKGEYYLSGSVIEAYRAPNNLTLEFWIAVPAKPKPLEVCSLCRRDWDDGHVCGKVRI